MTENTFDNFDNEVNDFSPDVYADAEPLRDRCSIQPGGS